MAEKADRPFVYAASLPRSGTFSLKTALEILGLGPVNHMSVFPFNKPLILKWTPALKEPKKANWRAMLPGLGFNAACDAPTACISRYILRDIPEAKLILVYREPEKWWTSVQNTVAGKYGPDTWFSLWAKILTFSLPNRTIYLFWNMQKYVGIDREYMYGPGRMNDFQEEIKELNRQRGNPPMLEWKIQDGWEPLCEFLGVPVPDQPFPRTNDTATFQGRRRNVMLMGAGFWCLWIGLASAGTYFGLNYLEHIKNAISA